MTALGETSISLYLALIVATVHFYLDFQYILEAKEKEDVNFHGKGKVQVFNFLSFFIF